MCHQESDFSRGEELARALARAFSELAKQVLVSSAKEIGLHVCEAQTVAGVREGLDNTAKFGRIDVTFAIALGSEVHNVDHAGEGRVMLDYGAHGLGQMLADVARRGRTSALVRQPI